MLSSNPSCFATPTRRRIYRRQDRSSCHHRNRPALQQVEPAIGDRALDINWLSLAFLQLRRQSRYVAYLILAAQQHDALPAYSAVMMGFVLPITVITLVVVVLRRPKPS